MQAALKRAFCFRKSMYGKRKITFHYNYLFPTCQVRVVRFYVSWLPPAASCRLLPSPAAFRRLPPPPDLNHDHPRQVFPAGPQPRPSTPSVPCRTSTATIHAKCSLPDLNRDFPPPSASSGPQPRPSTPSVPCGPQLGVDGRGWGPAGNTWRGWSWLRSGGGGRRRKVAVEVWQGTLGVDGRGWGPAGNTAGENAKRYAR